jgi:hypothetical protein
MIPIRVRVKIDPLVVHGHGEGANSSPTVTSLLQEHPKHQTGRIGQAKKGSIMSGPRVSFSGKIVGVPAPVTKPVVPTAAVQDDGSIFVSIASYRGT